MVLWDLFFGIFKRNLDPHAKRNIDKLVAVQRRATRWITKSDDDYDLRLLKLKLLSLCNWRLIRDAIFMFNVIILP